MNITRRNALGLIATGAAANAAGQTASPGQPRSPGAPPVVDLAWLDGAPPTLATGVSWGVPFPRGAVAKSQSFALTASNGAPLPLQSWPLAYWPDGSMKWIGFATVAGPDSGAGLRLAPGSPTRTDAVVRIQRGDNGIDIDTGPLRCRIPQRGSQFIESMRLGDREVVRGGRLVCSIEDRSDLDRGRTLRFEDFTGNVEKTTVEQDGPVRAVVRIEGRHKAIKGLREWLPFTVRLYFHAGQEQVRLVHTIVFDGDQEKDFISGLGLSFTVPMREQPHNRHVRFAGENEGLWAEPLQPLTGRRPLTMPGRANLYEDQLAGKPIPGKEAFDPRGQKLLADWAVWDSYKLVQPTADGFTIQKRTNAQSCWLDAGAGRRSPGFVFAGDVSGGLGVGVKNFWQSHPASLEVRNGSTPLAEVQVWLWSPDVPAMDLRHYDTKAHDLDSSYEDVQPGFSTPHGVARTSEVALFPTAAVPPREDTVHQSALIRRPPMLTATPAHIHASRVFGIWSLPDRSTPAKARIEDRLDAAFALYHKEVEQRHWYGFWNYGDVMHQHDGPRHTWRYDVGGFAWDNTELGTDMWLWYSYLRTGRADMFRMAEAMTRHTSEVDVYHLGRFAGLGSRHNVRHWGCGAKEGRISQAAYRRFYYYLSTDERTGDLMRAVIDADHMLLQLDPMRLAAPRTGAIAYPARIRGEPDWLAFAGNWMTEWERTGDTKYRDKILAGMDSIVAMPYGFLTGPDQLYGYDPETGKMYPLSKDGLGTYNLATIMGGAEVVFELNDLIEHPGWRKVWLQYCRLHTAPRDVVARDSQTGAEGMDARFARPGRLAAYVYRESKNPEFARKAWSGIRVPAFATAHVEGPAVLNPIDEVPRLSTNTTAQSCLEAIEVLEMCGGQMPEAAP